MMDMNRNYWKLRPHASLKRGGRTILMCLLPALITPAGAAAAAANPVVAVQSGQAQATGLTVVAADGVKSKEPTFGVKDFGVVDSLAVPNVEHNFILRNDSPAPVMIARLQASCGCTSVLLGEANETSKTLAPGEQVKVHAAVDVSRFRGAIHKTVRAMGADDTTLATMEISAEVKEPISFSTNQVDFGSITAGTARSIPLTVTLSPSLLAKGTVPKLVSSNPDVQVTPVAATALAAGLREQKYTLTIGAKAPIGPLSGNLSFASPPPTGAAATTPGPLDSVFQAATVPLSGEVVGHITATPRMVFFGTGQDAKQQVTLDGSSPLTLKNLKVTSASPWVTARLIPPASGKAKGAATTPTRVTLELSLNSRAPAGNLDTQVLVTTQEGERLRLPVSAYVVAAPTAAQ